MEDDEYMHRRFWTGIMTPVPVFDENYGRTVMKEDFDKYWKLYEDVMKYGKKKEKRNKLSI